MGQIWNLLRSVSVNFGAPNRPEKISDLHNLGVNPNHEPIVYAATTVYDYDIAVSVRLSQSEQVTATSV